MATRDFIHGLAIRFFYALRRTLLKPVSGWLDGLGKAEKGEVPTSIDSTLHLKLLCCLQIHSENIY